MNMHGKMQYMENYFDLRLDTTKLVPGSKSVVSLLYNYFPKQEMDGSNFKISKYAYGEDYHQVVKSKLFELMEYLQAEIGEIHGRAFVDSAPVLERAWAQRSGLGWIGKNGNLITKHSGSYFFLAELIIDIDLEYDTAIKDYCGTCNKCVDACPTNAIVAPQNVDGSKCISYFTIELKEAIPTSYKNKFENWIFGCDVCQDVCPWNRFAKPTHENKFNPSTPLQEMKDADWIEITVDVFKNLFKNSAVKRTKYEGLKRNINFVLDK